MDGSTLRRRRTRLRALALLSVASAAAAGAALTPDETLRALLAAGAAGLLVTTLGIWLARIRARQAARQRLAIVMDFLQHDGAPGFCTDPDGTIFAQNKSARDRFGRRDGATMVAAFESLFANPDAVVHRLRALAETSDSAREDVVTRRGHVRVAVHRIPGGFLWRLEDLVDRAPRAADGVGLPILTFGPSGTILFMNGVLRGMIGRRAKSISDIFEQVPLRSGQGNRLRGKSGLQDVRVVLSEPVNGRQEVFVLPMEEPADGRVALDSLPVALLKIDATGDVVFANRPARDLLPAAAGQDRIGFDRMVEGLGRPVREWVVEAANGRGLYRPEVVRVSGAETEAFLQVTLGRPLDAEQGGLIAVLNDATELKTMEAQFVQSQKMQAIGQLAGGVAHDFNNLLTAISGHCDLLLLRHSEGDEDYGDLTQITQNANRAAALVGQLLAFSRKQTLKMQKIDLRDTLGDLAHLLNRLVGERIELSLDHDPGLVPVRGDRRQLEQVLMNLVVNARDAMPEGGRIRIETRCVQLDLPMTRDRATVPAGSYVVVSVRDEGVGIPADALRRIFEPFFTTKRPGEGTGLGLSMAYGIVKQSGGFIFADSTIGQGATFSLYFPVESGPALALPAPLQAPALPHPEEDPAEPVIAPAADLLPPPEEELTPKPALDPAPPSIQPATEDDEVRAEPTEDDIQASAPDAPPVAQASEVDTPEALTISEDEPPAPQAEDADPPLQDEGARAAHAAVAALLAAQSSEGSDIPTREASEPAPSETTPAAATGPKDASETSAPPPVVLLVEDEAPVRAFASRALRLHGYEVLEAACAEDALDTLRDEALAVDLFVTDVMMPGMDGPSWVREALKKRPSVRTVFMSGYMQDQLADENGGVPNSVFLPKPFSLSDLKRTVEDVLP